MLVLPSPDQPADMRDEFSQILDSVWEETLPGDAKLCLTDMKVTLSLHSAALTGLLAVFLRT